MRIDIEKQIDAETIEIWTFSMFDLSAVLIAWSRQVKQKGKRKWTVEKFWDKYGRKDIYMVQEPALPEIIKNEALTEALKLVRVKTWDEWKSGK